MTSFAELDLTARTEELERAVREIRRIGDAGEQTEGRVRRSTDTMAAGFGALRRVVAPLFATMAAGLGIGAITREVSTFGRSMGGVQAVTQATTQDLQLMRETALQLGSTTEFSAAQAADGLRFLGMAGFEAREAVAALPDTLNLATGAGLGLAQAADIASNVLSGFGMQAGQAGDVADVLAAAASSANTDVAQLGRAMSTVAPISASLGISIEDTAAAIGVLSDAGIQGERAGTALRGLLASLASPTDQAREALAAYGVTLEQVDPQTRSLAEIMATLQEAGVGAGDAMRIFGREAASGALALQSGSEQLAEFSGELQNVEGAAADMAGTIRDDLQGDIQGLKSALSGLLITIGDAGLTGAMRASVQAMTDATRFISDNFVPALEVAGVAVVGLAATQIPALVTALATATAGMNMASFAAGVMTTAVRVLGAAVSIAGGPIGILLGVAGAAAAAIAIFRDRTSEVTPTAVALREAQDALNASMQTFSDTRSPDAQAQAIATAEAYRQQAEATLAAADAELARAEAELESFTIRGGAGGAMAGVMDRDARDEAIAAFEEASARVAELGDRVAAARRTVNGLRIGAVETGEAFGAAGDQAEGLNQAFGDALSEALGEARIQSSGLSDDLSGLIAIGGQYSEQAMAIAEAHRQIAFHDATGALNDTIDAISGFSAVSDFSRTLENLLAARQSISEIGQPDMQLGALEQDLQRLAGNMGMTVDGATEFINAIDDLAAAEGLESQARAARAVSESFRAAVGSVDEMSDSERQIYDQLLQTEQAALRLQAIENRRSEFIAEQGRDMSRQIHLQRTILQHGEDSEEVERLRANHARKEYKARLQAQGVMGTQLDTLMELHDEQAALTIEAERARTEVERLSNMDISVTEQIERLSEALDVSASRAATLLARLGEIGNAGPTRGIVGPEPGRGAEVDPRDSFEFFQGQNIPYDPHSDVVGATGGGGGSIDGFEGRLEALTNQFQTERDLIDEWHDESQEILADRRAMEILGEEEHRATLLEVEAEYQRRLSEMRQQASENEISVRKKTVNAAIGLLQQLGQRSEALAKVAVAVNAAQRIMEIKANTAAAVMRAYAELGPIAGSVAAAKIQTMGAVQMGIAAASAALKIGGSGSSSGGGGGVGNASSSGSRAATPEPARRDRSVRIEVRGEGMFAEMLRESVGEIADALIDDTRMGGNTIVVGR